VCLARHVQLNHRITYRPYTTANQIVIELSKQETTTDRTVFLRNRYLKFYHHSIAVRQNPGRCRTRLSLVDGLEVKRAADRVLHIDAELLPVGGDDPQRIAIGTLPDSNAEASSALDVVVDRMV
jgi:hypothetical protein